MCSKQYVIFVSYYSDYFNRSFEILKNISFSVSKNSKFIIVNNNPLNHIPNSKSYDVIVSDNRFWEFSAWEDGIKYIEDNYDVSDDDVVIFANDTFCQHRPFSFWDSKLFSRKFRALHNHKNAVVGDIDSFGSSFTLQGKSAKEWISTYLFAMSFKNVRKCLPLSSFIESDIKISNDKIKGVDASNEILEHLERWLFPKDGGGWYKSNSVGNTIIKKKLIAILNEKHLSCKISDNRIDMIGVYSSFIIKLIRKLRLKFI